MAQDPLAGDVVVLRDYPVGYRRRVHIAEALSFRRIAPERR
jgi:hypothetical protein